MATTAKPQINLTSLDFDSNKQSLIDYLKTIPEFSGFNFEGSNLGRILDLLAYSTSQNAFYAHLLANEMFLDTANDRRSVVSHAKMLGYTPKSASASRCTIKTTTTNTSSTPTKLPIGSTFTLTIDNQTKYNFCIVDDYSIPSGSGIANTLEVVEGTYNTISYTLPKVTATDQVFGNGELRLLIPDKVVDTKTLKVFLFSDDLQTSVEYKYDKSVAENTSYGNVYSLQENSSGFFEVVLNRALISGGNIPDCLSVASIGYVSTSGAAANSAFTGVNPNNIRITFPNIGGVSFTFNGFTEFPFGGTDIEDVDSIKLFAPRLYTTQNRAVTATDYKSLILEKIPGIETIRVVGGETISPPRYGQVLVSLKYENRTSIPVSVKTAITDLIKSVGMSSISPFFIEPDYIFVEPSISVKYQSHITNATSGLLVSGVIDALKSYNQSSLETFDSNLWNTEVLSVVTGVDNAIVSATAQYKLHKDISVISNTLNAITMNFDNSLVSGSIISSSFSYFNPKTSSTKQCVITDDGSGSLNIVWFNNSTQVIIQQVGSIDYTEGTVKIQNFSPSTVPGNILTISGNSLGVDLVSKNNSIILIDESKISVATTLVSLNN